MYPTEGLNNTVPYPLSARPTEIPPSPTVDSPSIPLAPRRDAAPGEILAYGRALSLECQRLLVLSFAFKLLSIPVLALMISYLRGVSKESGANLYKF